MLLSLLFTFFKIGLFTFGGGYAMISQIKETVVEKRKWLNDDELMQIITIAESTPGPIAINLATYVGYKKRGVLGSAFATLGVVIPSVIIIFIISLFLDAFMANVYVAYAFVGIKCAVAFLILKTGAEMFLSLEKKPIPVIMFCAVLSLTFILELFSKTISSVFIIITGGIIGIIVYSVLKIGKREEKES